EEQKLKEKIVPWRNEPTTYLQYKIDMEFSKEEYDKIDAYCRKKDIKWAASVWDLDSLEFLKQYNIPFLKIPSALITNKKLLTACKESGKHVYMSTGMSSEKEIKEAVEILGKSLKMLFHCNSSYPAKDNELNLNYISVLKRNYPDVKIGYSGHEEGISACIVAGVLGAEAFERHITISRSNWGTDQGASLVFDQIYRLVRDLNKIDIWLGSAVKEVFSSEISIRNKLRGL
ncbi:MAG: N-acetylneuraminate synthase family protein, partial [Spirochaetia bacterium]|nr:N-acetylneuraminate synthase family protein [Spirochaetia bacterium]